MAKGTPVVVALPAAEYASGIMVTVEDVNGHSKTLTAAAKLDMKPGYVYTATLKIAAPGIYNVAGFNAFASAANAGDYSAWVGEDGEVNLYSDISSGVNYTLVKTFCLCGLLSGIR